MIGGTGALGSLVVAELVARGDEVLVLSRSPGAAALPSGTSHRRIDLASGDGLAEGLAGAEVVVDASNDNREAQKVLVNGSKRLLPAEAGAGVRHHVAISVVGCDRVPMAYYGAKVAQEQAVESGPVPWSLLRATQFHTLLDWAFASAARFRVLPTGTARVQPIDPAAVAVRLADVAHGEPAGRLPSLAGPAVETLSELARTWRQAKGRSLLPVRIPMIGRRGRALRAGGLCEPGAAAAGTRTFEDWLRDG